MLSRNAASLNYKNPQYIGLGTLTTLAGATVTGTAHPVPDGRLWILDAITVTSTLLAGTVYVYVRINQGASYVNTQPTGYTTTNLTCNCTLSFDGRPKVLSPGETITPMAYTSAAGGNLTFRMRYYEVLT